MISGPQVRYWAIVVYKHIGWYKQSNKTFLNRSLVTQCLKKYTSYMYACFELDIHQDTEIHVNLFLITVKSIITFVELYLHTILIKVNPQLDTIYYSRAKTHQKLFPENGPIDFSKKRKDYNCNIIMIQIYKVLKMFKRWTNLHNSGRENLVHSHICKGFVR